MNPFLPLYHYVPDGEPRVFGDRVYLYGSYDVACKNDYCSRTYRVFSASVDDLEHWTDHGVSFSSDGPSKEVNWTSSQLFAPDVIEKDGTYFLYFCLADGSEGVAESNSPTGPFSNAKRLYYPKTILDGKELCHIDPAVFIDDDKKAYYFWGQFNSQGARLKDNMCELEEPYNSRVVDEENHFFHEGSSIRKRNGIYYFIFCSTTTGKANNLAYAMGSSPLGPYEYQGVLINNESCDPDSWNNHGSIIEIKGQWYIFYHRSSNNSRFSRRACVEPIYFDENGKILPVEMTSQGFAGTFNTYERIPAACACDLSGGAYLTEKDRNTHLLVNIKSGSYVGFKYIQFGDLDTKKYVSLRILIKNRQGMIKVIQDNCNGEVIGTMSLENCESDKWIDLDIPICKINNKHAIYFSFESNNEEEICQLNWLSFHSRN